LVVDAVDEHGRRDAVDASRLDDLCFRGARDLVVNDFFRLAALVAAAPAVGRLLLRPAATGQFGADGYRAVSVFVARGRLLFAGLARAQHAAIRIEFVRCLRDAIDIEICVDLYARVTRTHDRGNNRLDLAAKAIFISELALVGTCATELVVRRGAVG